VTGLPTNGTTLYARLYSWINGAWQYNDYTYTASGEAVRATPTFSVAAGTYTSAQSVTINDATAGAIIFYTTNGTTPTTSSSVYSGAITVSATETLEPLATASGYPNSAVAIAAYTISPPIQSLAISPTAPSVVSGTPIEFAKTSQRRLCHAARAMGSGASN
jgi:hypothetical protein